MTSIAFARQTTARLRAQPKEAWYGVAACLVLAAASESASRFASTEGFAVSPLTIALILGVLVGNAALRHIDLWATGIASTKKYLLCVGIVFYGFRLTLHDIDAGGGSMLTIDALVLITTFAVAMLIGVRVLKLDLETSCLVGAGAAICGVSAVLATGPVVHAKSEQVSIAVSTVAVFGTLAFLLYPALYHAGHAWLPGGAHGYGVFIGSTVHEVGQVIATANTAGVETADAAVLTKMGRVALLAPFLIAIAYWRRHVPRPDGEKRHWRTAMPWFPLLFAVAVLVNSFAPVEDARANIAVVDGLALTTAMAGLGLSTRLTALKAAGPKPLVLAGVLFVWLVVAGAIINGGVTAVAELI